MSKLQENPKLLNRDLNFLASLLDIVLTKNDFKFGTECYLQLQGTLRGGPLWLQVTLIHGLY